MENRKGLLVNLLVSEATGTPERDAVPVLLDEARERGFHPQTLGADEGSDTRGCVGAMRARGVTLHVAHNASKRSTAIDGRKTWHRGYDLRQRLRNRGEQLSGWMKTVGGFRRTRYRGIDHTGLPGYLVGTTYNLLRTCAGCNRHGHCRGQRLEAPRALEKDRGFRERKRTRSWCV